MGKERRERRLLANGSSEAPAGIDNTSRRTWNKDDYTEKAAQREAKVAQYNLYYSFTPAWTYLIFKNPRNPIFPAGKAGRGECP